jgi:hypothetical protein
MSTATSGSGVVRRSAAMIGRAQALILLGVGAVALAMSGPTGVSLAAAKARQPRQPKAGPGGSATPFGGVRVIQGGSSYDAWEILEPADPSPPSAPLVVVMHGYFEYSGYGVNGAIARHTALMGNVVIYPRWQTGVETPCPGPINIEPCITSAVTAIHDAIGYLHAHPNHVQPRLDEASYFGFSFGGIITADMTNRWKSLDLPKPRALFLDDPHDGALTGDNEPALDASLAGIPPTTKLVCHAGADGVIAGTDTAGHSLANGSCNAVFPKIAQIPATNKSVVLTSTDSHGQPQLAAIHGVCAGPGAPDTTPSTGPYPVDAYDWGFCWRSFDALRACALYGTDCQYALGNTPQDRYIGTWSDGVPIIGLKIQTQAPIRALLTPPRQAAPPAGTAETPAAPKVEGLRAAYSHDQRIVLHGTASGENGVAFVQVAIVRRIGPTCTQLAPTGSFIALRRCNEPTSFLFATGTTHWSLKLPHSLRTGSYDVFARAIDGLAQTPSGYKRSSPGPFKVT